MVGEETISFEDFKAALPLTIAEQVQAAAELMLEENCSEREYQEQFLLAAIACFPTEIGYELWVIGNEPYGEFV